MLKTNLVRASAASMLAPYLHGKLQSIPVPRFVEAELTLPPLDSLENAVQSIALIEAAVAENRLDVQSAQDLIGMINAYIAGKNIMEIAELQERLANIEQAIAAQPASSQTVHVQGGMPALPGTNITMPRLNGNEVRQLQTHSSALGEPSVSFEEREHAPVVHEDLPKSTTIEATAGEPPPNEAE